MKRFLYGYPTSTFTETVDNYMVLQGNSRRHHNMDYLIAGKWVWKDLLRGTIWDIHQVLVDVDKETKTLVLPPGISRLLTISVVDSCGNLQPLTYNSNMNTLRLRCAPKKCSCSCDGKDTLCGLVDDIQMRTENVVINGVPYTKRIWNRKESNGDLYEVVEAPYLDGDTVRMITENNLVCNLEVDEKGCIKATGPNHSLIVNKCGCFIASCHKERCDVAVPTLYNDFGYWKPDATNSNIIHLRDLDAEKVILGYQNMGDDISAGEIMIPEYAFEAFTTGLQFYSTRFRRGESNSSKEYARTEYSREKKSLLRFMHPILIDDWIKLSTIKKLW